MTGNFPKNTVVVLPQLVWVKVVKYCELSGDSKESVADKRKSGLWLEGVQYVIAPDGNTWVNLREVELWVQYGNLPARLKLRRGLKHVIPKHAIA
jgi:hypothetical protein